MKILENRPERYDMGINILSAGQAEKIRKQIVEIYVKPGIDMLDIGCGTGSLIIESTKAGARATGVDISNGMLNIAHRRIVQAGMQDKIPTYIAGAVEIDTLFPKSSFDLIVSTLVFSELYTEERLLVLDQVKKLLKPNGMFVVAGEVRPKTQIKRFTHFFLRFPLMVLTYLIAQTGTKPLIGISEEVTASGFDIVSEQRTWLDSFTILTAKQNNNPNKILFTHSTSPDQDISFSKTVWDYIGRWFPNPVEPGLRIIGKPDRNSEVILTSNFHLTVRRVEKSLKNENVFLLVAPTNGINVWCASCGGDFTAHSAIAAIKTSLISERVDHSRIILPQFSAPGIDGGLIEKETGRRAHFGPAYSKYLPAYLKNPKTVWNHNRAEFPFLFRLEMLLSMNFLIYFLIGLITFFVAPKIFYPLNVAFWVSGLILYAGYPLIPGKSGWLKAGILSIIEIIAIALISISFINLSLFALWKTMIVISAINLWLGFDLRGIVAGKSSEAEWLMHKLDMKSFGHIYSEQAGTGGIIHQNIAQCTNCSMCMQVCPKGVYGIVDGNKIRIEDQTACFACNACVTQCPENALFLGPKRKYSISKKNS